MPIKETYVPREIVLVHKGIAVYHCYKDNNFNHRLDYYFTFSLDDDAEEFDVRELPNPKGLRWDRDELIQDEIERRLKAWEIPPDEIIPCSPQCCLAYPALGDPENCYCVTANRDPQKIVNALRWYAWKLKLAQERP